MNTQMHIHIVEASLECLSKQCKEFWQPYLPDMIKAANYPDYFAIGEIEADKHAEIDPDWRDYITLPSSGNKREHIRFDPLKLRKTYPEMINHWNKEILNYLRAENIEKTAKFLGSLSHVIGDTGQAAHVFDEKIIKNFLPQGERPFIYHSAIEKISGHADISDYTPMVLGSSLKELNWRMIEELDIIRKNNIAEVLPIITAIMNDDDKSAKESATRTLNSCCRLFADYLYTMWVIKTEKKNIPFYDIDILKLQPGKEHCDMLFNYGVMVDRIPGKTIDEAVTLNLGGKDVHGIALLADMAPFFTKVRKAFVEYSIPANVFKYFESEIGLNHNSVNETKAVFKVKLDGKTVFTSEALGKDDKGVKIKVELGKAELLQLYVRDARPAPCGTKFFYPVFANPKLNERI